MDKLSSGPEPGFALLTGVQCIPAAIPISDTALDLLRPTGRVMRDMKKIAPRSVFANSDMRINMQFVEKLIQEPCLSPPYHLCKDAVTGRPIGRG